MEVSSHRVSEEDIADIMLNLAGCFQDVGGSVPSLSALKNQTAWEFLRRIAPNRIRFCVIKKEK